MNHKNRFSPVFIVVMIAIVVVVAIAIKSMSRPSLTVEKRAAANVQPMTASEARYYKSSLDTIQANIQKTGASFVRSSSSIAFQSNGASIVAYGDKFMTYSAGGSSLIYIPEIETDGTWQYRGINALDQNLVNQLVTRAEKGQIIFGSLLSDKRYLIIFANLNGSSLTSNAYDGGVVLKTQSDYQVFDRQGLLAFLGAGNLQRGTIAGSRSSSGGHTSTSLETANLLQSTLDLQRMTMNNFNRNNNTWTPVF